MNVLPISNTNLTLTFELPFNGIDNYGLLVESLDDLNAEPLLNIPIGSLTYELDDPTYSLTVQLGHRYRVVVLNASGRSSTRGKIVVQWGEEILVDEYTQRGELLVYAIERSFRIADLDGDEGEPTQSPSVGSTKGNLFDTDPSSVDGTMIGSDNLFKVEEPLIILGAGFHTIDSAYASSLGYQNSTIPVEVKITSNAFAMVTDGVTIAPTRGNALSLNGSSYVLANGGSFIGSSSDVSGYGIHLIDDSKIDIMEGVLVQGGSTTDQMQNPSAALYASGEAEITIRGGTFHGGNSTTDTNSMELRGDASVTIYGGSFFGAWSVLEGASIILHVCSFLLTADYVMAKMLDSSFLNVPLAPGSNHTSITSILHSQQECSGCDTTRQPTSRPTSLSPSNHPSVNPTSSPSTQIPTTTSPSRGPSISPSSNPTTIDISSPSQTLVEASMPPAGMFSTNSPTQNASDFAPENFPESSRPAPTTTIVPKECSVENVSAVSFNRSNPFIHELNRLTQTPCLFSDFKVCINSETITIDKTYAQTELGYLGGNITARVHIYNASDISLHSTVAFESYAVQISGGSTIKTGFGAEIDGGLSFRGQSKGVLMDGSMINGGSISPAVSVMSGSSVEITGGSYGIGDAGIEGGLSLSVNEIGSRIDVSGGSFLGGWFIGALSALYIHGCDFTINGNIVQGFLKDDTALDVAVKANGLLYFVDECPDVIGGLEEQLGIVFSVRQFGCSCICLMHEISCYALQSPR